MSDNALTYLGSILMEKVRDGSVSDIDMVLSGEMKGDDAQRIRTALAAVDPRSIVAFRAIVPALVDQVVHNLLAAIAESSDLELVVTQDGRRVNASDASDGLAGELYGPKGWIARFSRFPSDESR